MKRTIFLVAALAGAALGSAASPKSLYDELGGVHKIAHFVDMAVEMEAKDETLMANTNFRWAVETLGKAPLKFVVTNSLCSMTGGPQTAAFPDFAANVKWFMFTPEQDARAWALRMEAMDKAMVPKEAQAKLRSWFMEATAKVEPKKPAMETFMDKSSLYARLGGWVPISMVVDTFVNELAADPVVMSNPRTVKALTEGPATGAGIKYLVTEQLVAASGGPMKYSGRDMRSSHSHLMVNEKEWNAAAAILVRVLDAYKVPEKEKGEVLAAIAGTKGDIVKK